MFLSGRTQVSGIWIFDVQRRWLFTGSLTTVSYVNHLWRSPDGEQIGSGLTSMTDIDWGSSDHTLSSISCYAHGALFMTVLEELWTMQFSVFGFKGVKRAWLFFANQKYAFIFGNIISMRASRICLNRKIIKFWAKLNLFTNLFIVNIMAFEVKLS